MVMYGYLYIKHRGFIRSFRANESEYIYNYLTGCGCSHEEAEDIASWAELAAIGDEYYSGAPDFEIWLDE